MQQVLHKAKHAADEEERPLGVTEAPVDVSLASMGPHGGAGPSRGGGSSAKSNKNARGRTQVGLPRAFNCALPCSILAQLTPLRCHVNAQTECCSRPLQP